MHALNHWRMWASLSQGNVTISNDGATIMKKLEIVHPAAKTLVDISLSQDAEVCTLRRSDQLCGPRSPVVLAHGT